MKLNLKHCKINHKSGVNVSNKEYDQAFYIGTFGDIVINDSTDHSKAGMLVLSRKIYKMMSQRNVTPRNNEDSSQKKVNFLNQALQKGEYYGNLTLRSENTYLKSHVNELEEDIRKLYECNSKLEKLNKNLDVKLSFYQKKVHCFNEIYNVVIKHINSIFKKVGEHILEDTSQIEQSRDIAKLKMNSMFESEMSDLKQVFKTLQKQIKNLNEEYLSIKQNVTGVNISEDSTRPYISKILDSISSNLSVSGSEIKLKSSKYSGQGEVKKENEYSKYDLPLSQRGLTTRQSSEVPIQIQSCEKKVENSISPPKENSELKEIQKKNHILYQGQRRNIPASPNPSLRNEINKRIGEEKSLNNSRHNSVHQVPYLNYSGFGSQRGSARNHANHPSSFHGELNNSGSKGPVSSRNQLSRQSSEKMFGYKPVVSTLSKLTLFNKKEAYTFERSEIEKPSYNDGDQSAAVSGRDSYDNLKSFRKLIQSFRGEVKLGMNMTGK